VGMGSSSWWCLLERNSVRRKFFIISLANCIQALLLPGAKFTLRKQKVYSLIKKIVSRYEDSV
jgi:hypothetical protein